LRFTNQTQTKEKHKMAITVKVVTSPCIVCGDTSDLFVDLDSWQAWRNGMLIQDAFPELTPTEREWIKMGTHPQCWETMFEGEEE
jgi:hypothetical protein